MSKIPNEQSAEPARKIGGSYQADGFIVSRFKTRAGLERVVFEFIEPAGMLHIFGAEQVEPRAALLPQEAPGVREALAELVLLIESVRRFSHRDRAQSPAQIAAQGRVERMRE